MIQQNTWQGEIIEHTPGAVQDGRSFSSALFDRMQGAYRRGGQRLQYNPGSDSPLGCRSKKVADDEWDGELTTKYRRCLLSELGRRAVCTTHKWMLYRTTSKRPVTLTNPTAEHTTNSRPTMADELTSSPSRHILGL